MKKLFIYELFQLVRYLKDKVDKEEFLKVRENISIVNNTISEYAEKCRQAREEYQERLKLID